jgi:hypothetical protein
MCMVPAENVTFQVRIKDFNSTKKTKSTNRQIVLIPSTLLHYFQSFLQYCVHSVCIYVITLHPCMLKNEINLHSLYTVEEVQGNFDFSLYFVLCVSVDI